jgi:peroxin-5
LIVQYARLGAAGPAPPQARLPPTHASALERLAGPQAAHGHTILAVPAHVTSELDALTDTFEHAFREGAQPARRPRGALAHPRPHPVPPDAYAPAWQQPAGDQIALSLHAFMHTAPHVAHAPLMLPGAAPAGAHLSVPDKVRIRDRSAILARHLFADRGDAYADSQAASLLATLGISAAELPARVDGPVDTDAWNQVWRQQQQGVASGEPAMSQQQAQLAAARQQSAAAQGRAWADAFAGQHGAHAPLAQRAHGAASSGWVDEFSTAAERTAPVAAETAPQRAGAQGWVDEFSSAPEATGEAWVSEFASRPEATGATDAGAGGDEAARQSRRLAEVLERDPEGKFQGSQFLQFLSKMSQGQRDFASDSTGAAGAGGWVNEVTNGGAVAGQGWAEEFAPQAQHQQSHTSNATAQSWANDFVGTAGTAAGVAATGARDVDASVEAWAQDLERMQARSVVALAPRAPVAPAAAVGAIVVSEGP